jgi:hypothetical protein
MPVFFFDPLSQSAKVAPSLLVTPKKASNGSNGGTKFSRSTPLDYSPGTMASNSLTETTAKLHSDLRKEVQLSFSHLSHSTFSQQRALAELREQHDDLLGLLAQQEIELLVHQKFLLQGVGGKELCAKAKKETKKLAEEKYGSYVSYRSEDQDRDTDQDEDEEADGDDEGAVV